MGTGFQDRRSNKKSFLLSSCSPWVIVVVSGLWFVQVCPLRAMNEDDVMKLESQRSGVNLHRFYKDWEHPQTAEFWQTKDLSKRLEEVKFCISELQEEITNYKTNAININFEEIEKYKNLFKCNKSDPIFIQDLGDITYDNLLWESDPTHTMAGGWSAAKVAVLKCENSGIKIAIKKFKTEDLKIGLEELLYSLIALNINPSPKEIKMARIWDAAITCENSNECLNIIMECANGEDIHKILSKDTVSTNFSTNAIKACAEYLAIFHIRNYEKFKQKINREKYLAYAAKPFNTLVYDPLKGDENKSLFPLFVKRPLLEIDEQLSDFAKIKPDHVLRLLSQEDQEKFIYFAKKSRDQFEENASEIYRAIQYGGREKEKSYFLTFTHGDAHGNNFFYDDNKSLTHKGENIPEDSLYRVAMIDFASIIKTYGDIGDPAEDVGRFFGSLWDWAAKQDAPLAEFYDKIEALQQEFIQSYMKRIEKSSIFNKEEFINFKKIFKENCNFYKLRFYRIIANAEKDEKSLKDKDIKKKVLESWIKENAALEPSVGTNIQKDIKSAAKIEKSVEDDNIINIPRFAVAVEQEGEGLQDLANFNYHLAFGEKPDKDFRSSSLMIEELKERPWKPVEGTIVRSYLPDRSLEFIESAVEGDEQTYLTRLWQLLKDKANVTLSAKTAIAGMGGVGKTSLALAYAHEALENKAYNLIYWIPSSTEDSLMKAYKELLLEMNISHQDKKPEDIINSFIETVSSKGRCLLIYDNVPNPDFLKGKIPQNNTHILMTSRCNEGWGSSLNLNVFREIDSINYFFKVTGLRSTPENEAIAGELAEDLGRLPLALSHAAHYIKLVGGKNVSGDTFKKYLEDFRKESGTHFEEQRNLFKEPESEITYKNLIARTLSMSRKLLSEQFGQHLAELAEKIIGCSAYLDPDAIAEEIFLEFTKYPNDIREALKPLSSLSLIKKQGKTNFSMHRLVQLAMRTEQENQENQDRLPQLMNALLSSFTGHWKSRPKAILEKDIEVLTSRNELNTVMNSNLESLCSHLRRLSPLESFSHFKDLLSCFKIGGVFLKDLLNQSSNALRNEIIQKSYADDFNGYALQLLHHSPSLDSLNTIKKGELALFSEENQLYCKVHDKEKIQIIKSDNSDVQGIPAKTFDKIMQNLRRFSVALEQEKNGQHHFADFNYKQAYASITDSDKEELLQFTSLCGYTKFRRQEKNYRLNLFVQDIKSFAEKELFPDGQKYRFNIDEKLLEELLKIIPLGANQSGRIFILRTLFTYAKPEHMYSIIETIKNFASHDAIAMNIASMIRDLGGVQTEDFPNIQQCLAQTSSLNMTGGEQEALVYSLSHLNDIERSQFLESAQKLTNFDGLTQQNKESIISSLGRFPSQQHLESVSDKIKSLLHGIQGDDIIQLLENFSRLKEHEIDQLLDDGILLLEGIIGEISGETKGYFLKAFWSLMPDHRASFIDNLTDLLDPDMTNEDRAKLATAFCIPDCIEIGEALNLKNGLEKLKVLEMTGKDLASIVNVLRAIPLSERPLFIEEAKALMDHQGTKEAKIRILNDLSYSTINLSHKKNVMVKLLPILKSWMPPSDRILCMYKFITEYSVLWGREPYEKGKLGLLREENKLYCKTKDKEKIQIKIDDTNIDGINSLSFKRIMQRLDYYSTADLLSNLGEDQNAEEYYTLGNSIETVEDNELVLQFATQKHYIPSQETLQQEIDEVIENLQLFIKEKKIEKPSNIIEVLVEVAGELGPSAMKRIARNTSYYLPEGTSGENISRVIRALSNFNAHDQEEIIGALLPLMKEWSEEAKTNVLLGLWGLYERKLPEFYKVVKQLSSLDMREEEKVSISYILAWFQEPDRWNCANDTIKAEEKKVAEILQFIIQNNEIPIWLREVTWSALAKGDRNSLISIVKKICESSMPNFQNFSFKKFLLNESSFSKIEFLTPQAEIQDDSASVIIMEKSTSRRQKIVLAPNGH